MSARITLVAGFTLLSLSFSGAADAQDYRLGGPGTNYSNQGWSWESGIRIAPFKNAIEDSANFGGGGIVNIGVELSSLNTIDAASLAGLDGFATTYWRDSNTPDAEAQAIVTFFLQGGDLILMNDDAAHDRIGELLGLPTSPSNGSPSSGGPPLCDGPFGFATSVDQAGSTGRLSVADVANHQGKIGARNAQGEITAAYWARGDYAPGAGRLLILADVDMVSDATATYAPLDDNGRFALNSVAFLIGELLRPDLVVGGPTAALSPSSGPWSWDGPKLSPLRGALENPAYLGPFGIVEQNVRTADMSAVDAVSLGGVDVFVSSYWADSDSSPDQVNAVVDWFLAGGSLVLLQDDVGHDAIGERLGVPTPSSSNGTPSNGSAPYFAGPFGNARDVLQAGTTGRLSPGDLARTNGTISGLNSNGQITCAYWHTGQFAPGAGSLLIIADVGMVSEGVATYSPLNDNGMFALNAFSYSVESTCDGTVEHYGDGCPGSGGIVPRHALVGCPDRGEALGLRITDGLGGATARVAIGLNGRASLPFGGCTLYVMPPFTFFLLPLSGPAGVPGAGEAQITIPVPREPFFVGRQFNIQTTILDPGAASGICVTDAIEMVIGD